MNARPVLYGDRTRWGLVHADTLTLLPQLPENSVDVIICDPPYAIGFSGASWDGTDIRRQAGASDAISDGEAFERWTHAWASAALRLLKPGGFIAAFGAPRTCHRLACGIEDAGFELRDLLMWLHAQGAPKSRRLAGGRGTALKPAYEPVVLGRKPFTGTTIANVERFGTGALHIDAARIGEAGYWPAHVAFSHTPTCGETYDADCPAVIIDAARPDLAPSRLFFCAKATRAEREAGCEHLPRRSVQLYPSNARSPRIVANTHPTVKPRHLMAWLIRLLCPPGGLVLDPFAGSGTTGIAALGEGRQFLGVEREAEYVTVARTRLTHWAHQTHEGDR